MTQGPEPDPVEAAARLAESFEAFTGQLSRLHRSGTRNRVVTAVLCLVIAGLGFLTWQLQQTQRQQDQILAASHANQLTACVKANGDRKRDAAVWRVILKVPANAKPATQKELALLTGLVAKKDALRDCAALYATSR